MLWFCLLSVVGLLFFLGLFMNMFDPYPIYIKHFKTRGENAASQFCFVCCFVPGLSVVF